ncbi:MAG: hypothetical protein GY780_15650 [bacterium]|nr:hypothetical protein [bacterium]
MFRSDGLNGWDMGSSGGSPVLGHVVGEDLSAFVAGLQKRKYRDQKQNQNKFLEQFFRKHGLLAFI